MKTESAPNAIVPTTPAPAAAGAAAIATSTPKTATVTLRAVDGAVMTIVAERKADNAARTYVLVTDAAKKTTRGCTEQHVSFEAARAAIAIRASEAEKLGWTRPAAAKGFTPKPDAFTALPSAPKVPRSVRGDGKK